MAPKNRLRSMDIHKIVDVFNKSLDVPKYSRMVPFSEIEQNEFNLNLPRYIDSQMSEDIQDIAGHLQGGIPVSDVDSLKRYWAVCPELRHSLFKENRPGYLDLAVEKSTIKSVIYEHHEFASFIAGHERSLCRVARHERRDAQGIAGRLPVLGRSSLSFPRACSRTTPTSRLLIPTMSIST